MIARSFDSEFLNKVINHPSVYEEVTLGLPVGPIDMAPLLLDERNYFLATEHGGFLQVDLGDGLYEVHSQFLPEGRGKTTLRAAREAIRYMFTQTTCLALVTYCPLGNIAALALARAAGMTKFGDLEKLGKRCHVYGLTREEWTCQQSSH